MAYPSSMVMSRCSIEKCRSWVRLLRASYKRRASNRMVSVGNMMMKALRISSGFFESRVQVVVLEGAGLAEFVELQRQRQTLLRKLFRKMHLHDIEQAGAGCLLGGVAAPRADFQDGMHESRIARRAVGDAVLLACNGAHAHAAGRKHGRPVDAQRRHELRQLPAQLAEAA